MAATVLITGAARRLGRHIALHLAGEGYDIALHYNRSLKEAKKVKALIEADGRACTLFQCELGDADAVANLIPEVHAQCPELSVLINSASIFERAHLLETDDDLLDRHWQINFRTPFVLLRDFARLVKKGAVINMLDTKVTMNHTPYTAYSISKKALTELTRLAAVDLGPDIRVNGVGPGLILPSADLSQADFERMAEKLPLKRTGNPDKICQAVSFFLNHDYITGETLMVDGGEHLI